MTVYQVPGVFGAGGQILDGNAKPAAGALINTYAAGTTSPVSTFTTAAGNITAANPVVCAADGRLPNEMWQSAGQAIKIVLTDSLANTLGTYDNLTGINDPTVLLTTSNTWTNQNTFGPIVFLSPISVSSLSVSSLTVSQSLNVTGLVSFVSNLNVTGNVTFNSSLNVIGPVTFNSSLTVSSLTISGFPVGNVLLTSGSVTIVSTVDISFNTFTAYPDKLIVLTNFSPTVSSNQLQMRYSSNGGVSFITTANYDWMVFGMDSGVNGLTGVTAAAATSISLNNFGASSAVGNQNVQGINITINLPGTTNSTKHQAPWWDGVYLDQNTFPNRFLGGGHLSVGNVSATAIRLFFASGSISSGTYEVFGLSRQ